MANALIANALLVFQTSMSSSDLSYLSCGYIETLLDLFTSSLAVV